jgi:gliding motility-associated protein GldE
MFNLIALIILFMLSAFFSGSETALMSVNRIRIKELANQGDKKAETVENLLENHTRLLTTILIGNNLVNIAASAIATSLAIDFFGNKGVGIATGIVTFIVLVFGEITPKAIGNKRAVKYSKLVAPYLYWLERIIAPVISLFEFIIRIVVGEGNLLSTSFLSEEEIRRFVNVSEEEGVIKRTERKMINSIFEFDDTSVREVMVPRIDMFCISEDMELDEVVKRAVDMGYSRIPVYKETIDRIVGLLYVKDLLQLLTTEEKKVFLTDLMRPAYFIPESKKINELLTEMKKRKVHMAIVLDEYGGTAGLITIEDLLEEIVGDIQDEYDLEPRQIEFVNENTILVDARVSIDELNELLPEPLGDEENYETISGFILYHLGYLPREGEKLEFNNLSINIEEIGQNRIEKVKITSDKPFEGPDYREV